MYNNKIIKLIIIMLIIFMTLLSFNTKVFARLDDGNGRDSGRSDSIADPSLKPEQWNPGTKIEEEELEQKAEIILGVVNIVGVIISVVTLMIIGIKYMIGSVEEKAEYKKTMTTYLIGAILVFSVTTIPNILYQIAQSIS